MEVVMQKGINKATLVGFVGKDPVLRTLPTGATTTTLDLGTTRIWRDRGTQEQKSHTEWHRIVCWNSTANWAAEKIKAGMLVYTEGDIRYRSYRQGDIEKWTTEVYANDVTVLNWESKADRDSRGPVQRNNTKVPDKVALPSPTNRAPGENDIPF
jgi:single-strand DNA-binding protein